MPPTNEMLSRHSVYGSVAPPIWKVTWPCASVDGEVAVKVNVCGVRGDVDGLVEHRVPYGAAACCTTASELDRAGWPTRRTAGCTADRSSSGRSSWPIIESHGFTVPAGICAHSRPSTTLAGVFPLVHHGSFPTSKVPFSTRSYGGSAAATACGEPAGPG